MKSYRPVAYQITATAVTLNDLEGHSPVAGCLNAIRRTFVQRFTYKISTDSVLARFLCISRASCLVLQIGAAIFSSAISSLAFSAPPPVFG